MRLITINGRAQTLKEWCDELNVNRYTFYKRKKRGLSDKDALMETKYNCYGIDEFGNYKYVINGKRVPFKSTCKFYGIGWKTVQQRMRRGMTFEQALGLVARK